MASPTVNVGIRSPDGSFTEFQVDPGTEVSEILEYEAFRQPAFYDACLVTDTAEVLAHDHKVWEPQNLTLVRFKMFTSASSGRARTQEDLVFVEIPRHTTSVADGAFFCPRLQEVEIPPSVISIGNNAFKGCGALNHVNIPDSVTSIGVGAFDWCCALQSIKIPDSVTSIE